jgi:DNA replication initiation complex subunit (GINS family)
MTDIKITYESLFDLLRRERNREELQKLEDSFYQDVLLYLEEKKALLPLSISADYTVTAETEKTRIQFHNIKRILKELYDRREKKIILLAVNAVRTGASHIDKSTFLPEEQQLFADIMMHCKSYRRSILERVLQHTAPLPIHYVSSQKSELQKETPIEPIPEHTTEKKVSKPQASPTERTAANMEKIRFTKAVPRFSGGDDHVFGPYNPGDEALLPTKIAVVLVKKGRAEEV